MLPCMKVFSFLVHLSDEIKTSRCRAHKCILDWKKTERKRQSLKPNHVAVVVTVNKPSLAKCIGVFRFRSEIHMSIYGQIILNYNWSDQSNMQISVLQNIGQNLRPRDLHVRDLEYPRSRFYRNRLRSTRFLQRLQGHSINRVDPVGRGF